MVKSGKARAHTNIALIKYWGKADESYIIPMNNSLSVTLERFYTETQVTFDASLTEDQLILNGEEVDAKETTKIQKYMDIVRDVAATDLHAKIESNNFVPTAAVFIYESSPTKDRIFSSVCNVIVALSESSE